MHQLAQIYYTLLYVDKIVSSKMILEKDIAVHKHLIELVLFKTAWDKLEKNVMRNYFRVCGLSVKSKTENNRVILNIYDLQWCRC